MCEPDHNGPTSPSYFENIKQQTGPLIKDYEARIAQCSAKHCSAHGRCDTVPGTPSDGVGATSCTCYAGYSGATCATHA